ncbi:AraC family transcriptional regulator [Mongoliibacter ruber]|uniref:AraC-like DNA-binding protein n=1 Tax=Mongoliibacter ruber TaxID=1750599 RepID=A0A2T0WRC0_9BACT|nr:AraC family transcriptional regulator [Mongoliibacter ruber]PRY89251.1 AraC-like DNA-binding protein [Mongoliibacter ruber]
MKQPLQKSRIPESKAFVVKELIAPFFDKNWHFHSEYQLFWVLKGRGTRFIGDQMKPFKEGEMILTGPNLPHLWRNDQEYFQKNSTLSTHGIVVYFPEDFLGGTLWEKEEFEDIRNLLLKSQRGLEIKGPTNFKLRELLKRIVHEKGAGGILGLLEILHVLAHSKDCELITHAGYINTNKESEKDRMSQVYEYVMENFKKKIFLEEVAALANMTESAFSRYFTSRMNKPFSEFLSDVRIGHACKLLHELEANVSEICYESGFQTLSNFNRQFKERMGVTPMAYRKDYLKTFS